MLQVEERGGGGGGGGGKIKYVWSYDGIIHIKKSENERCRKKIFHITELEELFPKPT